VFAELKQIAEIFLLCNQQQLTKKNDKDSSPPKKANVAGGGVAINGTINAIPKGLEHLPFTIPPEEAAEIIMTGASF